MSQWITDRRPTREDGLVYDELVWVWMESMWHKESARAYVVPYFEVDVGTPWAPMLPPEPYVDLNTELQELKAENELLRKLCSKYERIHNALHEAGLIS